MNTSTPTGKSEMSYYSKYATQSPKESPKVASAKTMDEITISMTREDFDASEVLETDHVGTKSESSHVPFKLILKQQLMEESTELYQSLASSPHRFLSLYSFLGFILLTVVIYFHAFAAHVNGEPPIPISCRSMGYFSPRCGLNGIKCLPFSSPPGESGYQAIRCPSRCTWDLSSDLEVIGSGPYHGESRICRAAIHAGAVSPNGGCALLRFTGAETNFESSTMNGISTKARRAWFPKTFDFLSSVNSTTGCTDLSWLVALVVFCLLAGLAGFPQAPSWYLTWATAMLGYVYVVFASDPRTGVRVTLYRALTDLAILSAICTLLHRLAPVYTWHTWSKWSPGQRTLYWTGFYLVPMYITLHLNWFSFLPWMEAISLKEEKDSSLSELSYVILGILGLALLTGFVYHLVLFFRARDFVRFLAIYGCVWLAIMSVYGFMGHDYRLHFHHLIVGLLILPLTRFPSRMSMVAQGLAMGLILHGYARWGLEPFVSYSPSVASLGGPLDLVGAPEARDITSSQVRVEWNATARAQAYALTLNNVLVYENTETTFTITDLESDLTYALVLKPILASGRYGPASTETEFRTLAER